MLIQSNIQLARDMGLRNATLDTIRTEELKGFDWSEFIFRESLIRYGSTSDETGK